MQTISVFKKLIIEFFNNNSNLARNNDNILYVFQGFPLEFYSALTEINIQHFSNIPWDGTYADYNSIKGKSLLKNLIGSEGVQWCYYEELIALSEILSDFSSYEGKIIIVKNNLFDNYYPLPVPITTENAIKIFENENGHYSEDRLRFYYSDCKVVGDFILYSYVNKHYSIDIGIEAEELNFYNISTFNINENISDEVCEEISLDNLLNIKCLIQSGTINSKSYNVNIKNDSSKQEIAILSKLGGFYNVAFKICPVNTASKDKDVNKYLSVLKRYWGKDADFKTLPFYENPAISSKITKVSQGTIITDIINQSTNAIERPEQYSDLIVTAPTGAGKSLFFQIPGIVLHENKERYLTLVICPLVALMIDQVKELADRGVHYATYINSSLTYEERQSRLDGIKTGKYSIVYLSPELLLAYDIRYLIGDRKIGLMVIDESHLVTSWGRDFRVDYWFLGDYIEKVRRGSYYSKDKRMNFPVLCLTATAVYGGRDDIIGDLQDSLHLTCYQEHMYIGYVRRNNIVFKINHPQKNKSDKEEKISLTTNAICKYIEKKEKTIVYFPYKSQIEDVHYNMLANHSKIVNQTVKYYSGGDMKSLEKDEAYSSFRDSRTTVMMATKAFGMGVNIADVLNVYHFAPTGTLADYVQEIGRAARKLDCGYAVTDYLTSDMHYARTLWGLSGLRHYQIKAIMKKLYELYDVNKSRNLLFSPETFNYLFDSKDIDNKVKSGLMLLSSDLLETYHFKVIAVRPKNLFTKQYIVVPYSIEDKFLNDYGVYCTLMNDSMTQIELPHGIHQQVTTTKIGNVYEIDMALLWETKFDTFTFPQFKYNFFAEKLFSYGDEKIVPNMKLIITYDKEYSYTYEKFDKLADALQRTFHDIKKEFGGRNFTLSDFSKKLAKHYENKILHEYVRMLLDLFCYSHINDIDDMPTEPWKFIMQNVVEKEGISSETVYCIRTQKNGLLYSTLQRFISQAKPNSSDGKQYIAYLPLPKEGTKQSYQQLVASILQLFDFASYELIGGRNPQIFVRINDPIKLKRISQSNREYRNKILIQIEERHKRAVTIMNCFMGTERSNDERWDIIEDYFLGNDDTVDEKLGIKKNTKGIVREELKAKNNSRKENNDIDVIFNPGLKMNEYYSNWDDALELPNSELFANASIPLASYTNSTLNLENKIFEIRYAWMPQMVALVESSPNTEQQQLLLENGWHCFDANNFEISNISSILGV